MTTGVPARLPTLEPALRRVWRDAATLQIGLDAERGVVLAGVTPRIARVLAVLDGQRSAAAALEDACPDPQDRRGAALLVDLLERSGCLAPADLPPPPSALAPDAAAVAATAGGSATAARAMARRAAAHVLVVGAGRTGGTVAALLTASGVGRVAVEDPSATTAGDLFPAGLAPTDLGRPRGAALTRRLRTVAPRRAPVPRDTPPDVVVLASPGPGTPDPDTAASLVRRGIAHLALGVRETTAWVGPFVLPGRSACLGCVERHRSDRDPAWPAVATQLAVPAAGTVDPCDLVLATLAASVAARQVLALLEAEPGTLPDTVATGCLDGTLEQRLPDWRLRRRTWAPHPDCPCRDEAPDP